MQHLGNASFARRPEPAQSQPLTHGQDAAAQSVEGDIRRNRIILESSNLCKGLPPQIAVCVQKATNRPNQSMHLLALGTLLGLVVESFNK
jgi:hypothetical protein